MFHQLTTIKRQTLYRAALSKLFALCLSLCNTHAISANVFANSVKLYYENRPPFMQVQNGELEGTEGSPAAEALRAAHIEFTLSEAPVARQLVAISNNTEPACAVGFYWTSDRAKSGKYTLPITYSLPQAAVMRADNPKTKNIESMTELLANPSLSLILRNGYSYGDNVDALLKNAHIQILRPAENSHGRVKLVLIGMVDAALFTPDEAKYQIKQFGAQGNGLIVKNFRDAPEGKPRHLYCSKMVDDEAIKKINETLKKKL